MAFDFSNVTQPLNIYNFLTYCFTSKVGTLNVVTFTIVSLLFLLPLYVLIFYLRHRRRRQRKPSTTTSHSDLLTYHMIIVELINILGSIFCCFGIFALVPEVLTLGIYLLPINLTGQLLFHILTCVERYLAVVHPVFYLSLKTANGIRCRNVTIGVAWLLCFLSVERMVEPDPLFLLIVTLFVGTSSVTVIVFCSISVLCALTRPEPGKEKRSGQKVSQSKLRAFYTITVILGVLLLRTGPVVVVSGLLVLTPLSKDDGCGLWMSVVWFCLPSSLVLPLLFLHRAGKLTCFKKKIKSDQRLN